ncbi:MAG: phage portal protein [Amycolatopsis sp.]|uniref:phage portal protein n=1 Tax=Amycolatopsis sp. TaxID=37632 RepID=UPI002629CF13|nr:phage portal protein [Amycolatopsis sp.]MCU1687767.1 phage portal protein [Amycolatopsis sp.]
MRSLIGTLTAPRIRNDAPVPLTSRHAAGVGGFFGSRSNAVSELGAMGSVGTLFAIVNRTSNSTAKADWHLYRKAKTGKKEDRVEVTSHAALDLWNKPNPFMPQQAFIETFQQHVDLTGETDWVVSRNERFNLPLELWPVRPDRILPVQHPTKFLTGYVYSSPDGEQVPLGLNEVIQLKMPNPLDPYRGMGPVQALLTDLDAVRYSAEWNRNFFKNSAEPGGIIEVEDRLSDPEFDEMSMRWNEQHKGVANAHRVAIIERAKWVTATFSMKDMQFAELRVVGRDTIMEAFGISKTALGISDGVNRAVAMTAKSLFAEDLIEPRLERIKGALNNRLLPMYGPNAVDLEFDYDSPVPADADEENAERNSKAQAAQQYVAAGYDGDSVAVALDLPAGLVWEKPAEPPPPPVIVPAAPDDTQPDDNPSATPDPTAPPAAATTQQLLAKFAGTLRNAPPLAPPPDGWPERDVAAVAAVDLGPVQAAWEAALAGLLKHWQNSVVAGWVQQLVNAIRTAVGAGEGFTALTVDTRPGSEILADAMAAFAHTAAGQAVAEAAEQAVTLAPVWPTAADLQAAASNIATFEGQRYALTAGREAARVTGPDADADTIAEHIAAFLGELSDSPSTAALGGALTDAQNTARLQTLSGGPVGAIYASEQMDSATCAPCREIDGRFLALTDDQAAVYALYPAGGYIDCLGRDRCRGTFVGVWRSDTSKENAA